MVETWDPDKKKQKRLRRALTICALSLLLGAGIAFIIFSRLIIAASKPHRAPITVTPAAWNLDYEEVVFPSLDPKIELHGWLIPGDIPGIGIVVVHGSGANRTDPSIGQMQLIVEIVRSGYSVVAFDLRGHGESSGRLTSAGYVEKQDVLAAVRFLRKRGYRRVGLLGFSLGAAACIYAFAEDEQIGALVADSSYADLQDLITRELGDRFARPGLLLLPLRITARVLFGVDILSVRPIDALETARNRPVLLIHGERDGVIPVSHAHRLAGVLRATKEPLWVVPGARHVMSFTKDPGGYLQRILRLLEDNL